MNIFEEYENLLGKMDTETLVRALQEFFDLTAEIRGKLSGRAYLLDKYISYLLEGANKILCFEAAENGLMAGGTLRRICQEAVYGGDTQQVHPLYEKAKAHLAAHPMQFQEDQTKIDVLFVSMMNEYLKLAADEYLEERADSLRDVVDIVHLQQLYRQIADLIGSEALMERLNLAMRHRFLATPVMAVFMQGLTNDLLYCLIHRDMETSQQVFQLILERRPLATEAP